MINEKLQEILTAINQKQLDYFSQKIEALLHSQEAIPTEELAWLCFGGMYLSFDTTQQRNSVASIFLQEGEASVYSYFNKAIFFLGTWSTIAKQDLPEALQPLYYIKDYPNIYAAEHWGKISETFKEIYKRASTPPAPPADFMEAVLRDDIPESMLTQETIVDFKSHHFEDLYSTCTRLFLRGSVRSLIQMDSKSPFTEAELIEMACAYYFSGLTNQEAFTFLRERLSPALLEQSRLLQTLREVFVFYPPSFPHISPTSQFIFNTAKFKDWLANELGRYNQSTTETTLSTRVLHTIFLTVNHYFAIYQFFNQSWLEFNKSRLPPEFLEAQLSLLKDFYTALRACAAGTILTDTDTIKLHLQTHGPSHLTLPALRQLDYSYSFMETLGKIHDRHDPLFPPSPVSADAFNLADSAVKAAYEELRAGMRLDGFTCQETSQTNIHNLFIKLGELSPEERQFVHRFMQLPFRLRHSTSAIREILAAGSLKSYTALKNSHSLPATGVHTRESDAATGNANFVFFCLGIGDNFKLWPWLKQSDTHLIFDFNPMMRQRGWISFDDWVNYTNDEDKVYEFDDVVRIVEFDAPKKEDAESDEEYSENESDEDSFLNDRFEPYKTYIYQKRQPDGSIKSIERVAQRSQEVFWGPDILAGLALSILLEFRCMSDVGSEFPKKVFMTEDPEEFRKVVGRIVDLFYNIEAKMPCEVPMSLCLGALDPTGKPMSLPIPRPLPPAAPLPLLPSCGSPITEQPRFFKPPKRSHAESITENDERVPKRIEKETPALQTQVAP
ncbi:Uncharacterised protein (plasmid) [Legionella adelaidensis]|uniref:Uncharacterized protein n=1 Tax=Legionella adelaidensis TaxID=45056 RepID=A0A0W0R384_9GAMM|nr:hypothetical protein [Legionella adelaidensis]KTC65535.1 hypothetical protein Lade_0193 [Legionella adelaidensis]VEH84644.1 Uncharacterised protein [Legionella adelaidensis]